MSEKINLDFIKSNPATESEGKWFEVGEKTAFKMKRAGGANKNYEQTFANLMKPHLRKFQSGKLDMSLREKIAGEALIRSCMIDWKGFPEEPCDFSVEKAVDELLKPEWRDLIDAISDFAATASNFKDYDIEDLGNS